MQHNRRKNSRGMSTLVVHDSLANISRKTNLVENDSRNRNMNESGIISVTIGKRQFSVRSVDGLKFVKSGESMILPVQQRINNKKSRVIISKILKSTGLEVLEDIGDAILGKY